MMNIYTPADMASMTEATQADDGKIFISWVSGSTRPILMLDDAFNLLGNAADTLGHLTRTLEVSGDGMDLYSGSTWSGFGIEKWHSDIPGLLQYTPVDTFGNWDSVYVASTDTTYYNVKLWASSLDWSPDGHLLAGNLRSDWSGPGAGMGSKWYFFDVATGNIVEEVGVALGDSSAGGVYSPRGAAWDGTGNVMYLADYDYNMVSKWTRGAGYIEIDGEIVAKAFELQQNYPNPFNPVTKIPFKLLKNATVKLTVYNIEGQEVATLIDKDMNTGNHIYTYDASKLASGVYYYELNVESERLV
ncbi:MAG: T9SS type A sorting domain-containing protein, partial [Gammaproteobacteria bacterium]|nr:T9SS type A sorting domain-containing protein [Gammaproteobacteria bacterium]